MSANETAAKEYQFEKPLEQSMFIPFDRFRTQLRLSVSDANFVCFDALFDRQENRFQNKLEA